jgi:hypothetical protein
MNSPAAIRGICWGIRGIYCCDAARPLDSTFAMAGGFI